MDALKISGGKSLSGTLRVSGSKNTALPFLFSSLLFDEELVFENVPRLWDIETTLNLLKEMGASAHWDKEQGRIQIIPQIRLRVASYDWVKKMRAGILALGPLVAKYGEAKVSLPGGCAIGARPVDFHLEALRRMGASVEVEGGYIHASVKSCLKGTTITFPQVSVTGTENVLYLAAFAEGETQIENAAREPEVVALGKLLQSCGLVVNGLGTSRITIQGGKIRRPQGPTKNPSDRN